MYGTFSVWPHYSANLGSITPTYSYCLTSQKNQEHHITMQMFEEYRSQIEQRIAVATQGLARTSVRVAQLGTEEVIELFYRLFNIGELDRPIPESSLTNQL